MMTSPHLLWGMAITSEVHVHVDLVCAQHAQHVLQDLVLVCSVHATHGTDQHLELRGVSAVLLCEVFDVQFGCNLRHKVT
jgi:hypothetical protein